MKRVTLFASLFAALLALGASSAQATEVGGARRFGLGFAAGTPTSIVGKLFLDPRSAIDVGVGFWSRGRACAYTDSRGVRHYCGFGDAFSINADYLWQEPLARGTAKLDWHVGIGGRLWFGDRDYYDDNVAFAARIPVGLDLTFDRPSFLEAFVELAPAIYVVPGTEFDIEAYIGVRFYF